ncbi:MAG: DUF1559 domain-containing protein [Phycisphaerae bacterium]|nr:DUF1559 domain-containing protein [Phycisphaerae bacterium]
MMLLTGDRTESDQAARRRAIGGRGGLQADRPGFTLIEVLVVVAVVALLVAILLPALARARGQARGVTCLSNLRQMAVAAHTYTQSHKDRYPIAYAFSMHESTFTSYAWDFTSTRDWSGGGSRVVAGLLWQGGADKDVQQCPSFRGTSNWQQDPRTGYNYNTSYIGHGTAESIVEPARAGDVRMPFRCALFGDGEYADGANKFMRAPWKNPGDDSFTGRYSGTQGFRHAERTNVAFCDGHAEPRAQRFNDTYAADQAMIAPGTGFLSKDNGAYGG